MLEVKQLAEKENSIQELTVQFWQDSVLMDNIKIPLGQTSCEMLDLPDEILLQLHEKADVLSYLI